MSRACGVDGCFAPVLDNTDRPVCLRHWDLLPPRVRQDFTLALVDGDASRYLDAEFAVVSAFREKTVRV